MFGREDLYGNLSWFTVVNYVCMGKMKKIITAQWIFLNSIITSDEINDSN